MSKVVKLPGTARTPRVGRLGDAPFATGHGVAFAEIGSAATRIICACGTEIVHPGLNRLRVVEKHRQHRFLAKASAKVVAEKSKR